MNDMAFWVVMLVVGIIVLFVVVWIAVDTIVQRRKKKQAKKMAEQYERERAARRPEPEQDIQSEDPYVAYVGISKKVDEHIRFIQLKTKAAYPGEVMSDALRFYAEIVNMFEPGDRLLFQKSSEEWCTHFRFKPLERIEKKIES